MISNYLVKLRTRKALRYLRQYDAPRLAFVISPYVGR